MRYTILLCNINSYRQFRPLLALCRVAYSSRSSGYARHKRLAQHQNRLEILRSNLCYRAVLLFLITLTACSQPDFDIEPEDPRLVVYAFFESGKPLAVDVYQSGPPLGEGPDIVANAVVQVLEDGAPLPPLIHAQGGRYVSEYRPRAGRRYQVQVSAEGFPAAYSREETMPLFSDIARVETRDSTVGEGESRRRIFSQFTAHLATRLDSSLFFTHHAVHTHDEGLEIYWVSAEDLCYDQGSYFFGSRAGFGLSCRPFVEEITLENTNEDRGEDFNSRQRITLCQVNEATHRFNIALSNTSLNNDTDLFIAPVSIPTNIDGGFGILSLANCRAFEIKY